MDKRWFQDRLRQLRKTQRGLAKHMGLDPSRITEILNESRSIKIEEAVEMSDYLETSLDDLVTRLGAAVSGGASGGGCRCRSRNPPPRRSCQGPECLRRKTVSARPSS